MHSKAQEAHGGRDVPFLKIPDAAAATGLSQYYLRMGCRNGSVPHTKSGHVYMVNVPALLRKLNGEGGANA